MMRVAWGFLLLVAFLSVSCTVGYRNAAALPKGRLNLTLFAKKRPLRNAPTTNRDSTNLPPQSKSGNPADSLPEVAKQFSEVPQRRKSMSIDEEIKADIERMKLLQGKAPTKAPSPEASTPAQNSLGSKFQNFLSVLFVVDFFVILVFLAWFLAGVATQSTVPVVLERFQDIFQPVVVPALTVLMTGSIASGVLENMRKKESS
eukprot:gene35057-42457_t